MAVDTRRFAGNLGAGREWNFLRRDVSAHTKPRNHVAAAVVSGLDTIRDRHGRCHYDDSDRRGICALLHRVASHLRCGVYYSLSGLVRNNSPRGMKRLFPILAVLTAFFLAYATYQALRVAPTDALQGD